MSINKSLTVDYLKDFGYASGRYRFITTSGTITVPSGISKLRVHLWGGGAGGAFTSINANSNSAPGGCGGGYAMADVVVTPGMVLYGVVGDGGTPAGITNATTSAVAYGGGNGGATQLRLTTVSGTILYQATGATGATFTGTTITTAGTPGTGVAGTLTPDWTSTGGNGWSGSFPAMTPSTAGVGGGGAGGNPVSLISGSGGSRTGGGGSWLFNGGDGDFATSGASILVGGAGGGAGMGGPGQMGGATNYFGILNQTTSGSGTTLQCCPYGGSGGQPFGRAGTAGIQYTYAPVTAGQSNTFDSQTTNQAMTMGTPSNQYVPELFGMTGGGGCGVSLYQNSTVNSGNVNSRPNAGWGVMGGGGGGCQFTYQYPTNASNAAVNVIAGNGGPFGGGGGASGWGGTNSQCFVQGGHGGYGAGGGGAYKGTAGNSGYSATSYSGAGGPGIILIEW